jgi:hypothetical protein
MSPKLTVQNRYQRMAFAEWAQNNEVSFNSVWFSNEAHLHLDGASCTENYSVGRYLKSWTAITNFL